MENAPDTSQYGIWVPGIPVLVETLLDTVRCAGWLKGLIVDGIVGGVGAVIGFVPQIRTFRKIFYSNVNWFGVWRSGDYGIKNH